MRYWKGSIALNRIRDYPLLRQVLHSGFITHNQLFEFLRLDYCTSSRNAFNNRVLRLLKHGLLIRRERPVVNREAVYSVSEAGALELAGHGEQFVQASDNSRASASQRLLHHSLDLNEIHLALKRTGLLVHWMPETEIRSRNDLGSNGYWKYYDAVVVVRLAGKDRRFALEYERTPKAARHYCNIRQRIEQETSIAHFLYLVPNHDLLAFVANGLSECKRAVYVGLLREFLQQTLALSVRRSGSPASVTLISVLTQGKETQRTGALFPSIAV
jgi:Replication-relaxation